MTVNPDCLVSIIMPAYNSTALMQSAVASALAQTERNFELIIIDDASTDGTLAMAEAYADADPRVRVLRMPQNSGPAAARNFGMDAAHGRWIALLDTDDAYRPTRLERLVSFGEAHEADVVSDNPLMHRQGETPEPLIDAQLMPAEMLLSPAEFIVGNIGDPRRPRFSYGFVQPMFRRAFLDRHGLRHDVRNRFGEDFMLYVECLRHGARWWATPEVLYDYAVRPGSLTEVQSSGDMRRIVQLETDYLSDPEVVEDPVLQRALRRHRAKVAGLYAYRAFTDAVKARAPRTALSVCVENWRYPGYIAREAMRQAPFIAAKMWRGGYVRGKAAARPQADAQVSPLLGTTDTLHATPATRSRDRA